MEWITRDVRAAGAESGTTAGLTRATVGSAAAKRRMAIAAVLGVLAAAAWMTTIRQVDGMGMDDRFSAGSFGFFVGLWVVMMAAMMFPSFWPALAFFDQAVRRRGTSGRDATVGQAAFVLGYLAAWATYGVLAFALLRLASAGGLDRLSGEDLARAVVAPVALAAALYQIAPLKQACLRHCRGPISFFISHWREGTGGAVRLGARHGVFCVGCCWMIMLVLLAVGLMSLTWMAIAAIAIAVEKLAPPRAGRRASAALALGFAMLALVAIIRPGLLPGTAGMGGLRDAIPGMGSMG